MTLRQYLTIMSAGTAAVWASVVVIVTQIDPAEAPLPVIVIFYLALLAALTGTFAVIGFALRIMILRKTHMLSRQVLVSFRQAALLAALGVIAVVLRSRGALNWWNSILLILAATALEFIFISLASRGAQVKRGS
jgi:hypothetical protein